MLTPGGARRERGSVLILMPVAALIFVILGALAVDATVVLLAERELAGAAAAAANDAAARALDQDAFYADGSIVLDPRLAAEVVAASVAAKQLDRSGIRLDPPDVRVLAGDQVTVVLSGRAPHLFARALPGGSEAAAVSATATATAVR